MVLQTYRGFKKGFFFNIMKKFGIYKITCKVNNKIYDQLNKKANVL